ncbi:sterol 3-beta-glucosyltransferase [Aspergillus udagawae]|uniref:Sterol 3-beta-glucosyltransferase n=1 Tax=Aspergillus udagawae TaxID=91492 RepID=A0ABQ1BEX8_9EURO|nr:sterol 3-beta-glucosyltransferase [Aspergillus udagawae]GFG00409.1 sterol 3-beta-glucosyltransferase [Aspergillus udagawae]
MAAPPSHLFHWPGGIPPEIQVDGNDNTREQVDEEAQAPLGPSYRFNQSKWIKLYILSCRLDGELGHCLDRYGSDHGGIDPNPGTFPDPSTVQITDVLPRAILEWPILMP